MTLTEIDLLYLGHPSVSICSKKKKMLSGKEVDEEMDGLY